MSTTASDGIDEPSQALFDLMRDGVIVAISTINSNASGTGANKWRVLVRFYHGPFDTACETREFDSYISALDAFLKARVAIFTRLLKGEQVYSAKALLKRRELNLE